MLRLNKKIIFFLFTFAPFLLSQKINSIEVEGNNFFSEDELISWSGINTGTLVYNGIIDSVKKSLAHNLALRGYLNCDFSGTKIETPADSQNIKIIISIEGNFPAYVNKIKINYPDSLHPEKILSIFEYLEGQIFNKFLLEETIQESLTILENEGYPFSKIIISSIYFFKDSLNGDNFVNINLKLNFDRKSFVDKIEIEGNENTKDYVIKREIGIYPGEEYVQNKINNIPDKLNRLKYFDPVEQPEYYFDSQNEGVLLIKVKEKQTNNFDGIIGYIPSNQPGESGYLTGLVNISLRNLFGTGRAAAIRWSRFNRFSQELELKYLEPWIFGYPFNLNGSLFQRKQDTTYVQRIFQGGLEFLASQNISASVFISSESVIPAESENSFFTVYNSNAITTGVNLKIDTRDDPYAPTEGFLLLNTYSFSRKKINGPVKFITPDIQTNINLQRVEVSLNGFYEIFKAQIIALGLHGKELRGPFFEISDLYRLGGANSLRGYREDQFLGSRIFWSNFEYRLLLTRRTFGFLFFDTGYFFRKEEPSRNILKSEDFKIGYGLGLNIETGFGVLGVSYALAQGDSFSEGKIHFGLINDF